MNNRKTTPQRAYALLLCLLLLFSSTALAADSVEVVGTYDQTEARKMLQMVNDFRTGSETWYYKEEGSDEKVYVTGLKPLTYDYTLEKAAMQRAAEISIYFDHTRPNGSSFYTTIPKGYTHTAENIAYGFDTAAEMMGLNPIHDSSKPGGLNYGFLETNESYEYQGHRRTLLSDQYTAIGIGHIVVNGVHYWAQEFGSPTIDTNATVPNDSLTHVTVSLVPSADDEEQQKPTMSISFDDYTVTCATYKRTVTYTAAFTLTYKSSDSKLTISGNKLTIPANYVGSATISVTGTDSKYEILPTSFTITVKPVKPSISSLTVKKRKVTAKWKRDSRVTGYQVQYSTDKSFKTGVTSKKITKNSTVSLTTPALKKGATCCFRIRSYKTSGGKTIWSAWSSVKKIKVK